jgi:plastocyanin
MKVLTAVAACAALCLAAGGAAAADEVIVQKDKAFSQEKIVIGPGDRIVFRNQDRVTHNLFSRSPGFEFEVKVQLPGQDTPVTFERAGVAEVRCAIHPEMKLRVVVEEKQGGKP